MRLNLGCNGSIKKGYVNIDKDMYPGVDVVSDVFKLELADECASEIYASNILEHALHTKTLDVLKEWYRLLKPDGVLSISVPDFDRAIEIYKKCDLADWVVNFLWGDQGYEGAVHYCAFNEVRLKILLEKAGFKEICRVQWLPNTDLSDCSNLISNVDGKSVCLNMTARKI